MVNYLGKVPQDRCSLIGIVIVAHGRLAHEYLAAMEHVIGKQEGALAISVSAECDREERRDAICHAVNDVDRGYGVVIVTDIFGGTPSNLALAACETQNRRVIYGANLPLLIKLGKLRRKPLNEAVEKAITAARKYINCADSVVAKGSQAAV